MSFSIVIDGIKFILLNSLFMDRHFNLLYEVNGKKYMAYKSKSDQNWRFRIVNPKTGTFRKGLDYITTTQLNQQLQCYINDNYVKLPILIVNEEFKLITDEIMTRITPEFYDKINERIYKHDVFHPLFYTCPIGLHIPGIEKPKFCFKKYIHEYFSAVIPVDPIYSPVMERFKLYKKIELKKNINLYTSSGEKNLDERNILYNEMIKLYSEYMEYFFKIIGEPEYICSRYIEFPYSQKFIDKIKKIDDYKKKYPYSFDCKMHIFKIILELKDDSQKFILYYGTYKYKPFLKDSPPYFSDDVKQYKIILNLIPLSSKITETGLNDTFISSGIYIYKMFEYHVTKPSQVDYSPELPGHYTFIGDLLTNMWPLNNLKEPKIDSGKMGELAAVAVAAEVAPAPLLTKAEVMDIITVKIGGAGASLTRDFAITRLGARYPHGLTEEAKAYISSLPISGGYYDKYMKYKKKYLALKG